MRKLLTVSRYEYKMQLKRIATWGVLAAAVAIAMLDNYPSAKNLYRLEFLTEPAYFIYRVMSFDVLIMVFGLMFLLSSRMSLDCKCGVKTLMMASPISKAQYIIGKLLGAFLYTFTLLTLFLTLSTAIYRFAAPFSVSFVDCLLPLIITLLICALPVSLFISFLSVCLPAVIDIRLFYLMTADLFVVNAATVGAASESPFYLITSGSLTKLIWQHPGWPSADGVSVMQNLIFLMGLAALSCLILFLKRGFWRAEQ